MVEGSDASPKGVADIEVPLGSVVEKIRDRREAVLAGKVTPSTIPNFPNVPPPSRQSLVSIDDEEITTYRIEITTDNVVKQSVPARFSKSEAEEYLAEFDMVDTEGEFIPPPQISRSNRTKASPAASVEAEKRDITPPISSVASKEQSVSSKKSKGSVEENGVQVLPKTVRSLVGADQVKEAIAEGEPTQPPTDEALPVESPPTDEALPVESSPTQHATEEKAADESKPVPTQQVDTKAASTPKRANKEPVVTPKQTVKKTPEANATPTRGLFSSLRKRTNSGKGKSLRKPKVGAKKSVQTPSKSEQEQEEVKPMPATDTSIEFDGTPTSYPDRVIIVDEQAPDSASLGANTKSDSKLLETKGGPPVSSEPVDLDESVVPSVVPTEDGTAKQSPNKKRSPEDDETTKSMTTSSSNRSPTPQPPMTLPGEAAVEGLLEKFFDKVTCSCINDRCLPQEREKELPNYMVVEIQKIRQKSEAKKAEIAEKKQARKKKTSGKDKSSLSSSTKETGEKPVAAAASTKEKKIANVFEMKQPMKQSGPTGRKAVPTYEWGEKVTEQDSVTTASSAQSAPTAGFTVGAFIQKKFPAMFEQSASKDNSVEGASARVEPESDVDTDADVDDDSVKGPKNGAILSISPIRGTTGMESALNSGATQAIAPKDGKAKQKERVIILSQADDEEDGSESLLDAADDASLIEEEEDDDESEYTTELIQVDFDPSKLGDTTDADMYLAREVLRRYAEITGIPLDELIEDVVDESLASLTLDAQGFPMDREGSLL